MEELIQELDPAIAVLVGAFIPLVMAVLNRAAWSSEVKSLISFIIICAVGVGTALLMGMRELEAIVATTAGVYALSQVAYRGVWKPTGINDQIESSTG